MLRKAGYALVVITLSFGFVICSKNTPTEPEHTNPDDPLFQGNFDRPVIVSPKEVHNIPPGFRVDDPVEIKWLPVPGAISYALRVLKPGNRIEVNKPGIGSTREIITLPIGTYTAQVRVDEPDPGSKWSNPPVRFNISEGPDFEVKPDSLDFGTVQVLAQGTETVERVVTVVNLEPAELAIETSLLNTPNTKNNLNFKLLNNVPSIVVPNDSVKIRIGFQPQSAGEHQANLNVKLGADPGGVNVVVRLAGIGVAAIIDVDTLEIDFGLVAVNTTKVDSLLLRNDGNASLEGNYFISDDNNDVFEAFTSDDHDQFTLAAGETLSVKVTFEPKSKQPESARLVIMSNDPNHPELSIPLTGTGARPGLDVDPTAGNYDTIGVDSSVTKTFVLKNTGPVPLFVSDIRLSKKISSDWDQFKIKTATSFTVVADDTKHVKVSFEPKSRGRKESEILIDSDARDTPLPIPLVGRAISPPDKPTNLKATVDEIDSTSAINLGWEDNSRNEDGFEIQRGLTPTDMNSIDTVGETVENYRDDNLNPETRYYYRVRAFKASVNSGFSNVDSDSTRGLEPAIQVTPLKHDFGPIGKDSTATATFEIENTGQAVLNVTAIDSTTGIDFESDQFRINATLPMSLPAGSKGSFSVIFEPDSNIGGEKNTEIIIQSDAVNQLSNIPIKGEEVLPPAAPSELTALVDDEDSTTIINLFWTDNSNDEDGFEILRTDVAAQNDTTITVEGADTDNYQDTNLKPGTTYKYLVRAYKEKALKRFRSIYSASVEETTATE